MIPRAAAPAKSLSAGQVRFLRADGQGLNQPVEAKFLAATVRRVCGINAQFSPAMLLSLRARIRGLRTADVADAIGQARSVARTWAMRGTLHLVAAADLRPWVAFVGPAAAAKQRGRRAQLGLSPDRLTLGRKKLNHVLAAVEPMTRAEIMESLNVRGFFIDPRGQARAHLLTYAAQTGLICLGPDRPDGQSTYVLADSWLGRAKAVRTESPSEFAVRYLQGYGPASPEDFAAWSGLSLTWARQAWAQAERAIRPVRADGRDLWLATDAMTQPPGFAATAPVVKLLPAFDSYLLGYANRDWVVPPRAQTDVYHGGQITPVVLVNGLAAGIWRYQRTGRNLNITARAFTRFDANTRALIADEANDIGRLFSLPVSLKF